MIRLFVCLLGACSTGSGPAPTPTPGRVVSLHDTTTEMVVLLGREDLLVAITEPRFLSAAAAERVADVPRLPQGAVSAEAIAALRPALVLGTDVVAEQQPALPAQLRSLGIPHRLVDPAGLDGLWSTVEDLGGVLDASAAARTWTAAAQASLPTPPAGPPVRVFLYDCCDPPFTAGGRAPASELLERMGAHNVMRDQDSDWLGVSWEAAAASAPELIIVHDYPWEGQQDSAAKLAALQAHPLMAHTPAVRGGHLVTVPLALSLEGPRVLELPEALGTALDRVRQGNP